MMYEDPLTATLVLEEQTDTLLDFKKYPSNT